MIDMEIYPTTTKVPTMNDKIILNLIEIGKKRRELLYSLKKALEKKEIDKVCNLASKLCNIETNLNYN